MDAISQQQPRSSSNSATGGRRAAQQADYRRSKTAKRPDSDQGGGVLGQLQGKKAPLRKKKESNLVALRNLRHLSNRNEFVIPLKAFERVVREVAQSKTSNGEGVRFQPAAIQALQVKPFGRFFSNFFLNFFLRMFWSACGRNRWHMASYTGFLSFFCRKRQNSTWLPCSRMSTSWRSTGNEWQSCPEMSPWLCAVSVLFSSRIWAEIRASARNSFLFSQNSPP